MPPQHRFDAQYHPEARRILAGTTFSAQGGSVVTGVPIVVVDSVEVTGIVFLWLWCREGASAPAATDGSTDKVALTDSNIVGVEEGVMLPIFPSGVLNELVANSM